MTPRAVCRHSLCFPCRHGGLKHCCVPLEALHVREVDAALFQCFLAFVFVPLVCLGGRRGWRSAENSIALLSAFSRFAAARRGRTGAETRRSSPAPPPADSAAGMPRPRRSRRSRFLRAPRRSGRSPGGPMPAARRFGIDEMHVPDRTASRSNRRRDVRFFDVHVEQVGEQLDVVAVERAQQRGAVRDRVDQVGLVAVQRLVDERGSLFAGVSAKLVQRRGKQFQSGPGDRALRPNGPASSRRSRARCKPRRSR